MKAVILVNFGGPRSQDEIRPFLTGIFKDVLPAPLKFMAPILAAIREKKSSKMYASIGGASPVVSWTRMQAVVLGSKLGASYNTYIGMKYGSPSIESAVVEAREDGAENITLLPLFPYHSRHTSINLRPYAPWPPCRRQGRLTHLNTSSWHAHPLYITAMVSIIRSELLKYPDIAPTRTNLIFSAHAIPLKDAKVEPYVREIEESVSLIMRHFTGYNHQIAYQSAAGPLSWMGPSTKKILTSHKSRVTNHVLIVPLGFACENIETLYEIDKLYKVARAPALNNNPQFIDLLAKLVLESP